MRVPSLHDIPVWTVQRLCCTSPASSCPARGSAAPLVCVPSSTAMVGEEAGEEAVVLVDVGAGMQVWVQAQDMAGATVG